MSNFLKLQVAKAEYDAAMNLYNYAGLKLQLTKLQVLLCDRANSSGQEQMPLNAEAAKRYFDKLDNKD